MDMQSFYTVLITIITVLGSASAWRFYERRAMAKDKKENLIQDDCRERIVKLEALLEKASIEKEEMRKEILRLTALVAELGIKVEFLEGNGTNKRTYRKKT